MNKVFKIIAVLKWITCDDFIILTVLRYSTPSARLAILGLITVYAILI